MLARVQHRVLAAGPFQGALFFERLERWHHQVFFSPGSTNRETHRLEVLANKRNAYAQCLRILDCWEEGLIGNEAAIEHCTSAFQNKLELDPGFGESLRFLLLGVPPSEE